MWVIDMSYSKNAKSRVIRTILNDVISGRFVYRQMLKKLQIEDFGSNFQTNKKV